MEKEKKKYLVFRVEETRNKEIYEERYIGVTFAKSPQQALNNMRFRLNDWRITQREYGDTYISYCEAREA